MRPALLARFGIESLWERPYRYLSSGEGASCCWPGALLGRPELLVLDEPFDGLDQGARASLMMLLADLVSEGLRLVVIVNRLTRSPCHSPRPARRVSSAAGGEREAVLGSQEVAQLARAETVRPRLPPR